MVAEHQHQAGYREAGQDHVLDQAHADLGACGEADAENRDHEHDQDDGRGDQDVRPRAGGVRAEDGQDRGGQDHNPSQPVTNPKYGLIARPTHSNDAPQFAFHRFSRR
jgi:hypothetical protein